MSDTTMPTKSFWARPEGKTGMLFLVGILGGLYVFGPTLLGLLTLGVFIMGKAVALTAYAVALAAVYWIVTNKQFSTLCWYVFRGVCRWLTGQVIQIDPIGIMRNYISELKSKLTTINSGISNLSGECEKCKELIDSNENEAAHEMEMAKAAIAKSKTDSKFQRDIAMHSRQAERLRESNATLTKVYNTMVLNLKTLQKWRDISETAIQDIQNEVDVKSRERSAIRASYSVMQSIRSILNGDPEKRDVFERAMQSVADDYGEKLGAINEFIESSRTIVNNYDLQNGAYADQAAKELATWDEKADKLLLLPKPEGSSLVPVQINAASHDGMNRFLHP